MTMRINFYKITYKKCSCKIDCKHIENKVIEIGSTENLINYVNENFKNCTILDKQFIRSKDYIVH